MGINDESAPPKPASSGSSRALIAAAIAFVVVAPCLCFYGYWRLAENKREAEYKRGWDYASANYTNGG